MVKHVLKLAGCTGFLVLVSGLSTIGYAQNLSGPAEFPPASFTAEQYVDSRGCAFIRAGQGDVVDWVPRISRSRQPICGLPPSLSRQAAPVVAPQIATAPTPNTVPPPRVVRAAAPAPSGTPVGVATPAAVPMPSAQTEAMRASPNRCIIRARDGSVTEIRSRAPIRCGPQAVHPGTSVLAAPRVNAVQNNASLPQMQMGTDANSYAIVPEGYRAAWTDGRLNPMRGPRTAAGDAQMAQIWDQGVPARLNTARPVGVRTGLQDFFARLFGGRAAPASMPATIAPPAPGMQQAQQAQPSASPVPASIFVTRSTQSEATAPAAVARSSRNIAATAAIPRNSNPPVTPQATSISDGALVRAADFSNRDQAARTAAQLAQFGMTARLGRTGSGYAVLVGPFSTAQATERAVMALQAAGFAQARVQARVN